MSKDVVCDWKELYRLESIEQEKQEDNNNYLLKIGIITIVILFIIGIFGLALKTNETREMNNISSTLCCVEETSYGTIFYDKDTKVMYLYKECSGALKVSGCCITPMYNPDGSLKLWTGDKG